MKRHSLCRLIGKSIPIKNENRTNRPDLLCKLYLISYFLVISTAITGASILTVSPLPSVAIAAKVCVCVCVKDFRIHNRLCLWANGIDAAVRRKSWPSCWLPASLGSGSERSAWLPQRLWLLVSLCCSCSCSSCVLLPESRLILIGPSSSLTFFVHAPTDPLVGLLRRIEPSVISLFFSFFLLFLFAMLI